MPQIITKAGNHPKETEVWWDNELVGVYTENCETFRSKVRELMAKQIELQEAERLRRQ